MAANTRISVRGHGGCQKSAAAPNGGGVDFARKLKLTRKLKLNTGATKIATYTLKVYRVMDKHDAYFLFNG